MMPIAIQDRRWRYSSGPDAIAVSDIEINPAIDEQKQFNDLRAAHVSQHNDRSLCSQDGRIRFYPCIDGEAVVWSKVERSSRSRIRQNHFAVGAVKSERLIDFTGRKRDAAL